MSDNPVPSTLSAQPFFDDVVIGERITELVLVATHAQLFFFSAATYNGHRVHYDRSWAVDVEGYRDVLVQGPLQTALLARAVTDWAGPQGRLLSFRVQNRSSAFPGDELRFGGAVQDKRLDGGIGVVELSVRAEKGDGELLMPGTATVALPRLART
jgi:hydroxyacyl-ACP dehydratase HTD2-like protein with hotdog domain